MRRLLVLVPIALAACRDRSPSPTAEPAGGDRPDPGAVPADRFDVVVDPGRPIPGGALDGVRPGAARDPIAARLPCVGRSLA